MCLLRLLDAEIRSPLSSNINQYMTAVANYYAHHHVQGYALNDFLDMRSRTRIDRNNDRHSSDRGFLPADRYLIAIENMDFQLQPLFSVIVPVYNKEPHIHRSISSVLNQTLEDFELIIVNDSSTDNSVEEIMKFDDPRIRVLHRDTPGPGGYAARNLGIREARAEWVAFLDADDEWLPDHLMTLGSLTRTNNCNCVAQGWIDVKGGAEELFGASKYISSTQVVSFEEYLAIGRRGYSVFHMNTVAVHRDLLLSIGGFPADSCRRGGDVATWLKVVYANRGVLMNPRPGAKYYRDDSFVTKTTAPETNRNCVSLAVGDLLVASSLSPKTGKLLRQFSNAHLQYGLVSKALHGQLHPSDLMSFSFTASPVQTLLFGALSLLPRRVQSSLWRAYQKVKALLR